ncbi:MAG: hypothetical protein FWE36_02475 [Erysipelotrichales bacterium]|nr:hypothetical protein [Erysipelotrichales bacterium]
MVNKLKILFGVFIIVFALAACRSTAEVSVRIDEARTSVTRNTINLRIVVNDPQARNDNVSAILRAHLFYEDDRGREREHSSRSLNRTIMDLSFEGLEPDKEYRMVIKRTSGEHADLLEETFRTIDLGTEENPFEIRTISELLAIEDDLTGHFRLMNDLDFNYHVNFDQTKIPFRAIGTVSRRFAGTLDGQGYTIRNIENFDLSTANVSLGIFASVATDGVVKNLNFENINFDTRNDAGTIVNRSIENFGVVAGINLGTIENVHVKNLTVNIGSTRTNIFLGGIAGNNDFRILDSSVVDSTFHVTNNRNIFLGSIVGLMTREDADGINRLGEINRVFAENININVTSQSGEIFVGGIAGETRADIRNSFFAGTIWTFHTNTSASNITSSITVGGIVGRFGNGAIENVYSAADIRATVREIRHVYLGGLVGSFTGVFCRLIDSYSLSNMEIIFETTEQEVATDYRIGAIYGAPRFVNEVAVQVPIIGIVEAFENVNLFVWVGDTPIPVTSASPTVSLNQLNDVTFYTSLRFSSEIWNLTNLNNGRIRLR